MRAGGEHREKGGSRAGRTGDRRWQRGRARRARGGGCPLLRPMLLLAGSARWAEERARRRRGRTVAEDGGAGEDLISIGTCGKTKRDE